MSGSNCADGTRFVISKVKGTKKQFFLVEGNLIIAFSKIGEKFSNCASFTQITSQVKCKVTSGYENPLC